MQHRVYRDGRINLSPAAVLVYPYTIYDIWT